jgi:hypothetical protein
MWARHVTEVKAMSIDAQGHPTINRIKKAISSRIAAFKLDDDLRAVILFSLLGLTISFALIWAFLDISY